MADTFTINQKPGLTPAATIDLHSQFSVQIERIFWRKRDSLREIKKVRRYIRESAIKKQNKEVERRLAKLCEVGSPGQIMVQLVSASGTSNLLPIQPTFIRSLDEYGDPARSLTTIADVKCKVEETCGIDAVSQILFGDDDAEDELEDDATVEECGLANDQTIFLIIDTDRIYWHHHTILVRRYKLQIVHVIRLMPTLMMEEGHSDSPKARPRLIGFLKNCRKALGCMLERSTAHKARELKDLNQIERFLREVVMPIYEATCVCDSAP